MGSRPEPDFERFIASIARELSARRLPFMVIGGQAVLLHGEPRLTQDIDITLGVGPGRLTDVLRVCEALGLTPLPGEPDQFVRSTFVLPAGDPTGLRVDFIFSTTPYERQAIERAQPVEVGGVAVPFASAEDVILHKLFAGRPRDLEDAAGIVRRKGHSLDWQYMARWAEQFSAVEGRELLPRQLRDLRGES